MLNIISGAIWANYAWGRYWAWEPKETWSFVLVIILGTSFFLLAKTGTSNWLRLSAVCMQLIGAIFIYSSQSINSGLHSYSEILTFAKFGGNKGGYSQSGGTTSYITQGVTLRSGPGSKTAQVGKLSPNTQVAIIGSGNDSNGGLWSNIRVDSGPLQGRVGYVKPKYLNGEGATQTAPAPAPVAAPAAAPAAPANSASSFTPSFNCSKASTNAERLICTSQELCQIDVQLSQAYKSARSKSADKETFKREQINWMKNQRDVCSDVPAMLQAYQARIAQLSNN